MARPARIDRADASRRRAGFTLLEIMTAVTLALMLMYAVARIFSNVGGAMNETMSSMETANALRNAKNRLTTDLESLSVSPAPPRNSNRDEGYFCYVEGMGGSFERVLNNLDATRFETDANGNFVLDGNGNSKYVYVPFTVDDVALDRDRFQSGKYDVADECDDTVGDTDDILSFTAKAPQGQPFRGRFVEPVYDSNGNLAGAREGTVEAEYAEIVWFVRGTTLYRRVLPIVSNDALQESFNALQVAATLPSNDDFYNETLAGIAYNNIRQGFGFYRFYDVSVRQGLNGNLVANTLGDLSDRENRYFYWNSPAMRLHPDNANAPIYRASLHGDNGAWYWLRTATLQESAAPNFRAGAPFGRHEYARDSILNRFVDNGNYISTARKALETGNGFGYNDADSVANLWAGDAQALSLTLGEGDAPLSSGTYDSFNLPQRDGDGNYAPFIDFWNAPNVWDQVDYETGDLATNATDVANNADETDLLFNQDVVLTNVLSFNVRVWDENTNEFVDLGSGVATGDSNASDPNDLRSYGYYGNSNFGGTNIRPFEPCVYDTWSERYQTGYCEYDEYNALNNGASYGSRKATGTLGDIPIDGKIKSAQLPDYPAPYDVKLESVQIELRVFDPRSKTIRNATFNVDWSSL